MTPEWTEKERLALEWADALGGRPAQQGYETVLASSLRAAKAENEARVLLIRSLTKDRKDFAEQVEALELDLKSTRQVFNRMAHTLQENISKYDDGKMLGMPLEQAASALMSQFKAEADALRKERDGAFAAGFDLGLGKINDNDQRCQFLISQRDELKDELAHRADKCKENADLRAQLAAAREIVRMGMDRLIFIGTHSCDNPPRCWYESGKSVAVMKTFLDQPERGKEPKPPAPSKPRPTGPDYYDAPEGK